MESFHLKEKGWEGGEGKKEYVYFTHTLKNNFGGTYRGRW